MTENRTIQEILDGDTAKPETTTPPKAPVEVSALTKEQEAKAVAISSKLNSLDTTDVIDFGSETQERLSNFSLEMISKVSNNELGDVGDSLTSLMMELKSTNPDSMKQPKTIFGKLFNKARNSVEETAIGYQDAQVTIASIKKDLIVRKDELLEDSKSLNFLYDKNLEYFNELNVLIAAGQYKLNELNEVAIPALVEKTKQTNDQMLVQQLNDLNSFRVRLEKRVHDLSLARQISVQQAPQIRLIQTTNITLAEKIQSSILTAIPLWENQAAISIILIRQKDSGTATKLVSDSTNDLLKRNAEMLKIASIEAAEESERGVVDIETLRLTQNNLLETISETLRIQEEGSKKRAEASKELALLETQLKNKLLETVSR